MEIDTENTERELASFRYLMPELYRPLADEAKQLGGAAEPPANRDLAGRQDPR